VRTIWAALLCVIVVTGCHVAVSPEGGPQLAAANSEHSDGRVRDLPDDLFGVAWGPHGEAAVTGYHGAARISTDGGLHWSRVETQTSDLLRRAAITDDGTIFAVSSGGKILKAVAGEGRWQVIHEVSNLYLRDVAFADSANGWVVGHDALILHTTDAGATWRPQELAGWTGRDKPRLNGIAILDKRRAVIVGEFGLIAWTADAGGAWQIVSANKLPTLLAVSIRDEHGVAVGLNGTLVRLSVSERGPITAEPVETGLTQHLLAVSVATDGQTAVVGGKGFLKVLRDGHLASALAGIDAVSADGFVGGVAVSQTDGILAVGNGGVILRADRLDDVFQRVDASMPLVRAAAAVDRGRR
jgi:photosystem II stability/assembly factor-like uncharacterized protein